MVPRMAARWGPERLLGGALVGLGLGIAVRWIPAVASLFVGSALIWGQHRCRQLVAARHDQTRFPTRISLLTSAYATVMAVLLRWPPGWWCRSVMSLPGGWYTALGSWIALGADVYCAVDPSDGTPQHVCVRFAAVGCRGSLGWRGWSRHSWDCSRSASASSSRGCLEVFQDNGVSTVVAGWLAFLVQADPVRPA